ncbi:MAG: histidine phosphatase family protein [Ruminococcus sp.]|nr:histidine phosphatase family protein [Ruminococcus sp.]
MVKLFISSPLTQCRRTIALLPNMEIESVIYTDILMERNMGVLEGVSKTLAIEKYPELFHDGKIDVDAEIPKVESIHDVILRIVEFSNYIKDLSSDADILLYSYNQLLKVMYSILKKFPINNTYWYSLNFKNGEIIHIDDVEQFNII